MTKQERDKEQAQTMTDVTHATLHQFFRRHKWRKLTDPVWLAAAIAPQCRNEKRGWMGGALQLMQDPQEFALFLTLLARHQVKSYAEIGVYKGASLYLVDSYLRALFPDYRGSTGFDIADYRLGWEEYKAQFPQTEFVLGDSAGIQLGDRRFDAGFIDGGHVERIVMNDYEKLRDRVHVLGFHDIASKKQGVNRAWVRILVQHPNCRRWQFITTTPKLKWMKGIGVVRLADDRGGIPGVTTEGGAL
jgi:hypothetical protein